MFGFFSLSYVLSSYAFNHSRVGDLGRQRGERSESPHLAEAILIRSHFLGGRLILLVMSSLVLSWLLWLLPYCGSSFSNTIGVGDTSCSSNCHWFSCSSLHTDSLVYSPITPLSGSWLTLLHGPPLVRGKHTPCASADPQRNTSSLLPPTLLAASHLQIPPGGGGSQTPVN